MKECGQRGSPATPLNDLICCHHDAEHYGKRNIKSRGFTKSVIDGGYSPSHQGLVISKSELLRRVEDAAASRAEIARVLGLAPARITEMYKGTRELSFDEARRLLGHYKLEGGGSDAAADPIDVADALGFVMVEEVDLALGMGAAYLDHPPETKGFVPFKADWLRGIHEGPLDMVKVVRGNGDSMQPTILDGDFVLIDLSQTAIRDQDMIWAVSYGDLGMIRRVRQTPRGSYMLMPDNQVIRPIEAVDGEMHLIGRVIWIGRRM